MVKYKNIITGATIETDCICSGEFWEQINSVPKQPKKSNTKKAVKSNDGENKK